MTTILTESPRRAGSLRRGTMAEATVDGTTFRLKIDQMSEGQNYWTTVIARADLGQLNLGIVDLVAEGVVPDAPSRGGFLTTAELLARSDAWFSTWIAHINSVVKPELLRQRAEDYACLDTHGNASLCHDGGDVMRSARERLGLDQQPFADRLNAEIPGLKATQVQISRWERGEHTPHPATVEVARRLR